MAASPPLTFFGSTSAVVGTGTVAATATSIAYLFHPAASTRRLKILKILVGYGGGSAGDFSIRLARITAENGTPGGVLQTIRAADVDDTPDASLVFRSGAAVPTRETPDRLVVNASAGGTLQFVLWDASVNGKPLVCRPEQAEGWEVRTVVERTITTAANVGVSFVWTEE